MGMIYKRGNVWWIKYYRNGKRYRESSKTTKKMVAKKTPDRREGEIAQGKVPGVHFEKVTLISWQRTFFGTIGSTRKNRLQERKGASITSKNYLKVKRHQQ